MNLDTHKYEEEYVYYVPYKHVVPDEFKNEEITKEEAIQMMRDFLDFCEFEYANRWNSVQINQEEFKALLWLMNKIVREDE